MQNFSELGCVELGFFYGGRQNKKQLIDFRGYPSPQLELELSWQVGAKVDQYQKNIDHIAKQKVCIVPLGMRSTQFELAPF